ncbi:uncharacterized protein LOC131634877 [Vicia villosa]|uniref:uncharacterized protein LOC131634877 n=1 Tax=Vicia villosa TaxID=3911 RepID=UPI00273B6E1E|nr:uncharacterized protein LOC131634877 [Vicia villosa]
MAGNNNNTNQTPDPFHLDPLIHGTTAEGQNRHRREGQQPPADGQGRPRHEIPQPGRNEQAQNNRGEQAQNNRNEQPQVHNRPEQARNQNNEADSKDGQPASSFTHTSQRQRTQYEDDQEEVDAPEDTESTTVLLLAEIKKTNRLIQQQSEQIDRLERKRRSRSPPRRRHRSRSPSSSRSPPKRHRRRSPSFSRSPPRRYRRRRSYSRSPPRKSRKNQKPEVEETGSLSPEQDHQGPTKTVAKTRERSPPEDNRKTSGKSQEKPRRKHSNHGRHSTSPGPSDEEEFRSPLPEEIRRARLPRGMENPLPWISTTGPPIRTTISGASKPSWIITWSEDPSNVGSSRPRSEREQ